MTELEKNRLFVNWLITNAKTRLFLAKSREQRGGEQPVDVSFLPLAAKGNKETPVVTTFSKDYNFEMRFIQKTEVVSCQLQAKGYAAVSAVAGRQVKLNFVETIELLITFDDKGYAEINLPPYSDAGQNWHTLTATLTII